MRVTLLFASVVLAVLPAGAQSLLPEHFAGWQTVASSATAVSLGQLPSAQAAILRDCHEQSAERRSYQRNGAKIDISLYRMGDSSWAYSAYSMLRPAPVTGFRPTPHAAIGEDGAMMLVGNLLVDINGKNLAANGKDLVALAAALKPHASRQPYPTLWQYMPTEHLVARSDRYALDPQTLADALVATQSSQQAGPPDETKAHVWPQQDWLGFDDAVEAETGLYRIGGAHLTLILASYPTPQLATEHLKNLARWFDINPVPGAPGKLPVLYARLTGSMLGLVSGATGAAQAEKLLGQIHYQTVITWNEPGFKLKDLTMPQYLLGMIFGTITIILITLVVGIALGFIRIGVKRTLPGVVFDRRRSIEVIQLGLTSKPIDPTDFY